MSNSQAFISFPSGYLGSRPAKFPMLVDHPMLWAISKPSGMACHQHAWSLGKPDISMALRREILNEKPQIAKLGIKGVFRIFNLEADASGVLLFAKTEEGEAVLRNAYGSRQLKLLFHILVDPEIEEREAVCELPVAQHSHENRALVSHKTGKKCSTLFRYLRHFGRYQLWEAETADNRLHQVRLHAAECGLKIIGDPVYGRPKQVHLSDIKRDYRGGRGRERPIYEGVCLHLVQVRFEVPDMELPSIEAPLPGRFANLLKQLDGNRG